VNTADLDTLSDSLDDLNAGRLSKITNFFKIRASRKRLDELGVQESNLKQSMDSFVKKEIVSKKISTIKKDIQMWKKL